LKTLFSNVKDLEMEKKEVPLAAIERNVAWIAALENALAEYEDVALTRQMMKATGRECARQILDDCSAILGKRPETVDELMDATNRRRRQRHNLVSIWERQGNTAHLAIEECACTLVRAGLAKPNPIHCLCSVGMMETLFESVCKGPVRVEVVKTVGTGADGCEFYVHFGQE
jgi:predicted hydrocarbon binding protein